jgi:hypothetical protein
MPRGGRREGAGRKPGSKLTKSQLIAAEAREAGISPLELQLTTMRELWRRAHANGAMDMGLATQACQIAKDCAPYIHPRLGAIEAKVDTFAQVEVKLTDEERVRQARAAIAAAFAEVAVETTRDERESDQTGKHRHTASEHDERNARPDRDAVPIPREFAREGELEAAPGVARLPTRYHVTRVLGNWSG